MLTRDTQSLDELETALQEAGMASASIEAFKAAVRTTHMTNPNAQTMPGASSDIMKIALEWNCRFELKLLLQDFGNRYHLWVAKNEAVIAMENFENSIRGFASIIPMEEIEVALKTMRHAANQCKDPKNVKHVYTILGSRYILPNIPTLDAEKLHAMINSLLEWLTQKCDEMGNSIFRKAELIPSWLELEENVRTQKSNPASLELLKAVRERDTETIKKLMGTPDGKRCLDERIYRMLLPHLTEELN